MIMFLKRLETVGFKSFAERTKIEFVPGVTAVVGPNGSGKSNIIDAIRWVLGEQSAKSLRGQKMEDIIFQGSDTRNPLNFAEVSLILNNENEQLPIDYQEVNITRRVYRSGESEFFINKQACRLKDIVDLFIDTGLGRDSFSIIGQGKIDEILSSKAEERRAIFEEAAGVLKYKLRKNKAVFKLSETEDNLDRVEDIIHEIKQQLEPLKEQAEIAKKYKKKKAELEKVEVALLVTEIEQLHEKWQTLLAEIEDMKLEEMEKSTSLQEREARVIKERQEIERIDKEISSLQNELVTITEQIEQHEGKRNVFLERMKHVEKNKHKLLFDRKSVSERTNQLREKIASENEALREVTEKISHHKREISEVEQKLFHGLDIIQEEIEDLKSDYIEFLNEQAVLQNEKQTIEKQKEQIKRTIEREKKIHEDDLAKERQLTEEVEHVSEQLFERKQLVEKKEAELHECRETLISLRKEYEDMQRRLYEGNEQIATFISRKEMLEEMKESYQGFFYGVKEILKAKKQKRLANIEGVVLDLIDVPNKYVTAIDMILGAQAQYVVVPDDETAREVIEWLKRENKGRATFLPLKSIEARTIPNEVKLSLQNKKGFIGIASELVRIEEKYKVVTEHLMGNVIITDDLRTANEIAHLTKRKYRIVTLDGDIVYPGGSMSGGAKKKTSQSLFTREKEIATLTEKIKQFTARRDSFVANMKTKQQQIVDLEHELSDLEATVQRLKDEYQTTEKRYNELNMLLKTAQTNLETYHYQLREKEDELKTLRENKDQLTEKLKAIDRKIKHTEQTIDRLTNEQQSVQKNKKLMEEKLHELQVKVAEQEERKKNYEEKMNSLYEQLREFEDEAVQLDKELDELKKIELQAQQKEQLTETIKTYKEKRENVKKDIEQKRLLREEKSQRIEDEEREVKQLSKLQEQFVKEIQEKELQASRLDVNLENKLSFLQSEYVTTYEKAKADFGKVDDIEKAREVVKQIKRSIEQLGTVNLGSIDEYDRLMKRYQFLMDQKEDLMKAKDTLYSVIKEMDEEMTKRFGNIFKEIQAAFTTVFKQLFGGGYAELRLTDPDDLLETGIDIVARPPGKKLRSLELLSGGERALTAIALLFAILRARPIPFCILDEVDAALDEANVERFGQYLKSFSDETQFVVITHRKGTMEEADALYGVTMQESGVSRLVSVKLEDMDELVAAT